MFKGVALPSRGPLKALVNCDAKSIPETTIYVSTRYHGWLDKWPMRLVDLSFQVLHLGAFDFFHCVTSVLGYSKLQPTCQ